MMDYIGRNDAPFDAELWGQIDEAVVDAAKKTLVARRFLPLYGPLGAGADVAKIDAPGRREVYKDGFAVMTNRTLAQIPLLYEDFWLYWRDMAEDEQAGLPVDLTAARVAGKAIALREDKMVFYGVKALGIEGILTAKGTTILKMGDWSTGENAYADLAAGMTALQQKEHFSRHTMVLSPDLFFQLQRIQPGTGMLEIERISKVLGGRVYMSVSLEPKTAFIVAAEGQYIDLAVGQDICTGYTESVDMNAHLRVLETAIVRIKAADAIVVYK